MKNKIYLLCGIMLLTLLLPMISARTLTCEDNVTNLWNFDEGSGTIAIDSCGTKNGTINDANYVTGKYNYALNFDGVNDFVDIGTNISKPTSISLWFDYDTLAEGESLVYYGYKTSGIYKWFGVLWGTSGGNQLIFGTRTSTADYRFYHIAYATELNSGWNNVVVSWEGTTKKMYLNGLELNLTIYQQGGAETNSNDLLDFDVFKIGRGEGWGTGSFYYFDGAIDDVATFNKSITPSETISFYADCDENWVESYTPCGYYNSTWDKKEKYYIDSNSCGTNLTLPEDNGTLMDCNYCSASWDCFPYSDSCSDSPDSPSMINCSNISLSNNATCCNVTGLSSDCDYGGDYSEFSKLCGNISVLLVLPSYPYVDFNTTYDMQLFLFQNDVSVNASEFKIEIQEQDGNWTTFNWSWDNTDQRFEKSLIFLEEGSYPFVVSAYYPYDAIQNITGTLIVKKPYYITFRIWEREDIDVSRYYNDFGFVLIEFKENRHYDPILENFIYPFVFSQTEVPVFHAPYTDGEATIKLYEFGEKYEVRFVDGEINFNSSYSIPEIIDGYGTNFYIGEFVFNGTDDSYDIYLVEREIHQYRWLFNLLFVIALISVVVVSVFLFFVIPQMPQLSFYFGIGFSVILVIVRSVLWIWVGW